MCPTQSLGGDALDGPQRLGTPAPFYAELFPRWPEASLCPVWALVSSSVKWGLGTEGYEVLSVTHPLTPGAMSRCCLVQMKDSPQRSLSSGRTQPGEETGLGTAFTMQSVGTT